MKNQPWLLPEVEREERSAAMREAAQRVRDSKRASIAYLRGRDFTEVIDRLLDAGPQTECAILSHAWASNRSSLDDCCERTLGMLHDLYALWRVGKLWRIPQGIHPGAGEESFLYGIRGVHEKPE